MNSETTTYLTITGCKVRIQRAGDVIPEVVERVEEEGKRPERPFKLPERCPACGTETVREGAYVLCPAGLTCAPQLIGHLLHYAARNAMNIEGLGESTARKLVDAGVVEDVADLYALDQASAEALEGFATTSARKLVEEIQATKEPRLDKFLFALGIRHVGERVAQQLAEHFGSLEAIEAADWAAIDAVADIGPEIARSVHKFFQAAANRRILDKLCRRGVKPRAAVREKGPKPLEGKTFVFTGTLKRFTREDAQEKVEALGGRATSSVSRKTDYLVIGAEPGSKLDQAQKHGVQILGEAQFAELVKT